MLASLCEEQLGSRPDDLLASYLVGVTLKTLISSSTSLLAYFHEVLRHLQNVFCTVKVFLLHIDLMIFTYYTFLSVFYKEQKKLKCPCSFPQSLVLKRLGCTYRETEKGHATRCHYVSEGTGCYAR